MRVRVAIVALLVFSALSANVRQLIGMPQHLRTTADEVSRHEQRLAPLKKVLPQREMVGFIADGSDFEQVKRYYMTSYALTPLLVARGTRHRLVVGDFVDPGAVDLVNDKSLRVRQDFGKGLVLFERE